MKKQILFTLLFGALFLTLSGFTSVALAQVAGKFTVVKGRVDVLKVDIIRGEPVKRGDMLFEGDIVRTKSDGYAEIELIDGSKLKLAPKGRLQISKMLLNKDGSRNSSVINLFKGKLRSIVSKSKKKFKLSSWFDSDFRVNTATAVVGVKGTDFVTVYMPNMGFTIVTVEEGGVITGFNGSKNPNFSYANMQGGGFGGMTLGKFMEVTKGQVISISSDGKMDLGNFVPPSLTDFSFGGGTFGDDGDGGGDGGFGDDGDGGGGDGDGFDPYYTDGSTPDIPVTDTFPELFDTFTSSFVMNNLGGNNELVMNTTLLMAFELVDLSTFDFALTGDYTMPDGFNAAGSVNFETNPFIFSNLSANGELLEGSVYGTLDGTGAITGWVDVSTPDYSVYMSDSFSGKFVPDASQSVPGTETGTFSATGSGTVYVCEGGGCAG